MSRRTSPGFISTGVLILLLVLYWFGFIPMHRPLAWVERSFMAPLYQTLSFFSESDQGRENAELRGTIRAFMGDTYTLKERERLEESTKRIDLWAADRQELSVKTARIISQFSERGRLLFLIDHGERSGIRPEQTVMFGTGFMVGRIVRANPETALFELVSSLDYRASIRVENGDTSLGVARGRGEYESISIGFVPRESRVDIHDSIITSGMDSNVPRGLLIGTVQEIRTDESGPWKTLIALPLIRPTDLTVVGVLTANAL